MTEQLTEFDSVRHAVNELIGGQPNMDAKQLATQAQCSVSDVFNFWRSMGFALKGLENPTFTDADCRAMEQWNQLVEGEEQLLGSTAGALVRAQSQVVERLVVWQFEAMVQDLMERLCLDDTSARLVLVDRLTDYREVLEDQLVYTWRRRMAALLTEINQEVGQRGVSTEDPDAYPLDRCTGFVDMVAYTRTSAMMSSPQLAELIDIFERTCRTVVNEHGGRVVKTIGDAVMFVASDVRQAADISCGLIEGCSKRKELLPVRASMVRGNVVSRSGDIFGPPVNLAARICDIAPTGNVYVDASTAHDIQALPYEAMKPQFDVDERELASLQGFGLVQTYRLYRNDRG